MHSENADFIRGESVVTFMINFSWRCDQFFHWYDPNLVFFSWRSYK